MLENSSNIKEQQQQKGTESLIPQKRSAGVIQVWAFKNNNALFWSRLVAPSRIFYLENTFMVRCLCPKIWVYRDISEGGLFAILHALVFSIYGRYVYQFFLSFYS